SVTLTATPNAGYVFEGWYKGGTKIAGATATYTFNAAGAGAYVAKFKEAEKITIKAVAGENGTVDKASQQVTEGTSVTIIATPKTGFFFDGWYKGETKVDGADATFTVNANANATYTAKFTATAPTPWLLNGRIPSGNFEADADIRGVNGDYDRVGWYVGYDTDATHPRATVTLDTVAPIAGEKSLKVVGKDLNWCNQFKKGFSFAAKSDGFMFKIKTAKDMNFELSFYDKNDAKFYFKNLNVAGSNAVQTIRIPFKEFILERDTKSMADQDFLFTHKFQLRIIANAAGDASYSLDDFIFIRKQPQQITITTSVEGGHGTALPATTTVEEGSNVTLSAVAEDGYEFEDWYLDGTKLGASSDTYVVKATKNANYVAKFKKSEAVDPKPEDDNQGFTEAFDPTKPGAVSKPGIGDITVDANVQLNGKSSAKWDFDFTADKTGAQNFTDVTNANFSGDGFSMLVKSEKDITVRVRLESDNPAPGFKIWTQKMYMTFEQEVKGSPDAQLISWSYSEAVRGAGLTNAVFAQLNHKNTALKMSLLPSKANPTAPVKGSFYFGAVDAIDYNSMIKEEKPTEPTVERYMVKISADGKGKVTGGGEFDKDQLVQLGAEPNTKSYVFAGWFEGDKLISLDANYSFKAEKNITLVGKFVRKGSPEDPSIGGGDGDNSGNGDNNGGSNNGGNGSNNGGNGSNGQPNTSDTTPIALLMTLILASGVLGTIVFVKRQKSK
ncbi:MAG: InlB B-repeat-containing protein, partial [Clostridia bacterium]